MTLPAGLSDHQRKMTPLNPTWMKQLPDDSFDLSCHPQLRITHRCLWNSLMKVVLMTCPLRQALPSLLVLLEVCPSPEEGTDDIYQVQHILKERSRQGKHQFYIKWRGYSPRFNT